MPKSAIISPMLGVRENVPNISITQAFQPESSNVIIRNGEAQRLRMRLKELLDDDNAKTITPDGYPIIKYHRYVNANDEETLFVFTKAHIYVWSESSNEFTLLHTCASDCTEWSVVSYNAQVIATNNVDKVLTWVAATPTTSFTALVGASGLELESATTYCTKAKYVAVFENYLFVGHTTESATVYPHRVRWCSVGDETDWVSVSGSGDAGKIDVNKEGDNYVKGFGIWGQYLAVFKTKSIHKLWLVTGEEVFNEVSIPSKVGLLATGTVVNDSEGRMYFLGSDYKIREVRDGIISEPVSKKVLSINPAYADLAQAAFIDEYSTIWFAVPTGDGATGNNTILDFNPLYLTWAIHDIAIRAFGDYTRQSVWTIDTWPYDTIDTISQPTIDDVENVVGFPLDLASDYDGYTYDLHQAELDDSASYTGSLVLSSALLQQKEALGEYKRISYLQLSFRRKGSGTALVEAKQDNQSDWQTVGSVDMTGSAEILTLDLPCDLRAKHLLLRISGTNAFSFLGVIYDYEWDGDR